MFKYVAFFALLAVAFANPEPKAKPGVLAAAYTAPVVGAPVAYTAPLGYSAPLVAGAPLAYTARYAAAPLAYSTGFYPAAYSAYSAYTAPVIVAK